MSFLLFQAEYEDLEKFEVQFLHLKGAILYYERDKMFDNGCFMYNKRIRLLACFTFAEFDNPHFFMIAFFFIVMFVVKGWFYVPILLEH